MRDRVFVDTNVLVYVLDESEPEKQRTAQDLVASASSFDLVVSTQILQELYAALTRGPDPIRSQADAEEAVREAAKLVVVQVDSSLILEAIVKSRQHKISFWDALVVQAAETAGCARLWSEDLNHSQAIGAVRVENPFVASGAATGARPRAPKGKRRSH